MYEHIEIKGCIMICRAHSSFYVAMKQIKEMKQIKMNHLAHIKD